MGCFKPLKEALRYQRYFNHEIFNSYFSDFTFNIYIIDNWVE